MKYKIILFDADGTLFDFKRSEREALKEALLMSGIDAGEDELTAYSEINLSLWKLLERKEIERSVLLYKRFDLFCEKFGYIGDSRKISDDYIEILSHKGYMLEGAEELLSGLFGRVRMYIVTNGLGKVQEGRYACSGIAKYFDNIYISEYIGHNKPDARFFDHVMKDIPDFDRDVALVVGDSLTSDIKGANNAGLDCCWYDPSGNVAEGAAPTYTALNFEQVFDIISGKNELSQKEKQ